MRLGASFLSMFCRTLAGVWAFPVRTRCWVAGKNAAWFMVPNFLSAPYLLTPVHQNSENSSLGTVSPVSISVPLFTLGISLKILMLRLSPSLFIVPILLTSTGRFSRHCSLITPLSSYLLFANRVFFVLGTPLITTGDIEWQRRHNPGRNRAPA